MFFTIIVAHNNNNSVPFANYLSSSKLNDTFSVVAAAAAAATTQKAHQDLLLRSVLDLLVLCNASLLRAAAKPIQTFASSKCLCFGRLTCTCAPKPKYNHFCLCCRGSLTLLLDAAALVLHFKRRKHFASCAFRAACCADRRSFASTLHASQSAAVCHSSHCAAKHRTQ